MAHSHDHSHDPSSYYIEQLCTIGICGTLGGVAVTMYARKMLGLFLDPKFHPFVLYAGLTLIVLVVIRAVAVWQTVGTMKTEHSHDHDHAHGSGHHEHEHTHECAHGHEHHHDHSHGHAECHDHSHDHSHGHDHDHGWNPWRYAVLLLPIVLFFLNLPNQGFSSDWLKSRGLNPDNLIQSSNANYCSELGIQLKKDSSGDLPQVEKVNSDTPAEASGIQVDDTILQVTLDVDKQGRQLDKPEITNTNGMTVEDVVQKLSGPAGTSVTLKIQRPGTEEPFTVALKRDERVIDLEFKELERAALTANQREYYMGRKGRIKGQFSPSKKDKAFTLMRLKMTCCSADVTPLQVWIEAPDSVAQFQPAEWIEVEGKIRFDQAPGKFIPVLTIPSMDKIRKIPPEPDIYVRY